MTTFDPMMRPLAPVDRYADEPVTNYGWCGRLDCGCGHDFMAGITPCDTAA
jgi:hypothetical protein